MSTTLGDPVLISNYAVPSWTGKKKQGSNFFEGFSTVYATHTQVPSTSNGHITVAVQRDGIHILDLSDFHPVQSHTLGPSTSFSCPPLTVVSSSAGVPTRRTYAAMQNGQGVTSEEEGKILWQWSTPLDDTTGASGEKRSSSLPHRVCAIMRSEKSVLCLSRECDVSVVGENLQVQSHWKPTESQRLLKVFVYPKQKCSFAGAGSGQAGIVAVMFGHDVLKKVLRLYVLSITSKGETSVLDTEECPISDPERVVDVSCDPSGHLSFISNDGSWTHVRAELREGKLYLSSTDQIRLRGLLFASKREMDVKNPSVSILALRSSFVLLAGVTSSPSHNIAVMLWDVQYGVLLNSHMLSIPSPFEGVRPSSIAVNLIQGSPLQALLSITPFASAEEPLATVGNGQLHSTLLVLPNSTPSVSTIASALVQTSEGTKWLDDVPVTPQEIKLAPDDDAMIEIIDEARQNLLEAMQEAVEEENPEKADKLFFEWYKVEAQIAAERAAEIKQPWQSPWKKEVNMNDMFIRRLLEVTLQPGNPRKVKHSSEVLRFLLEKRTIGHGSIGGGLLPVLLQRSDWGAIFLALRRVPDIPENVFVQLLLVVVKNHRKKAAADIESIDADDDDAYPPLHVFLAACINYPASSVAARTAVREHLKDSEDMFCILEVLVGWLDFWCEEKVVLLQEKKGKRGKGEKKDEAVLSRGSTDTPELPSILFFLQAVLDSSFITLVQHPPSHVLLRQTLTMITPLIEYNEEMERLRGPLEPFAVKSATEEAAKERREEGEVDKRESRAEARKREREEREMEEVRIGAYEVEEVYL